MKILNLFKIKNYFKTISKNSIHINCSLKKSKISITGKENILNIDKSNLKKININIEGDNNKLLINKDCHIRNLTIIMIGSNLNLSIGKNCQIGEAQLVCAGNGTKLIIGENALFAHGIEIRNSDGHSIYDNDKILLNPNKDILIENNVWLSQHVKILKGTNIGSNSVVAMSSVVSSGTYPKNSILAGIPAKIVKKDISWSYQLPN